MIRSVCEPETTTGFVFLGGTRNAPAVVLPARKRVLGSQRRRAHFSRQGAYSVSFFPLDREIRKSSLWAQGSADLLKVWLYLLLEANPRTGVVSDAEPAIAMGCNLDLPKVSQCLIDLSQPDEYSRSETQEGRRIKKIRGGWRILNYRKYSNKDYSTERVRRWRDRQNETVKRVSTVTETTDTDTDTDTDTHTSSSNTAQKAPTRLPKKKPKKRAAPWLVWDSEKEELRAVSSELVKRDAFIHKWSELLGSEDRFWYEKTKADKWLAANEKRRQKIRRLDLFLANTWFGNCLRGDE